MVRGIVLDCALEKDWHGVGWNRGWMPSQLCIIVHIHNILNESWFPKPHVRYVLTWNSETSKSWVYKKPWTPLKIYIYIYIFSSP